MRWWDDCWLILEVLFDFVLRFKEVFIQYLRWRIEVSELWFIYLLEAKKITIEIEKFERFNMQVFPIPFHLQISKLD